MTTKKFIIFHSLTKVPSVNSEEAGLKTFSGFTLRDYQVIHLFIQSMVAAQSITVSAVCVLQGVF